MKMYYLLITLLFGCNNSGSIIDKSKYDSKKQAKYESETTEVIHSINENDTTRNSTRIILKENFFYSTEIEKIQPEIKKGLKAIEASLTDIEYRDTSGILFNSHELIFDNLTVEIDYINNKLKKFSVNGKNFAIIDSSFMGTQIEDFTMDTYFVHSYIFKPNFEKDVYLIQIGPPNWTGNMSEFRLYYFIKIKEKVVYRFIA